jgi:Ca2+:H+ antiporter
VPAALNPPLATPRLRLEPLVAAHADALFVALADPAIYRYVDDGPPASAAELRARYARLARRRSPDGAELWLNWALVPADASAPVGFVQATVRADRTALVAYVLAPAARGRGLAAEAVAAMLEHLAAAHDVRRALATVDAANAPSLALLERLGFAPGGPPLARARGLARGERLYVRDLGEGVGDGGGPGYPGARMAGMARTQVAAVAAIAVVSVVAGVLDRAGANGVLRFVVAGAALAGLAWIVALATEAVGASFGPAATGVLQSTLGNLPELFVVIFALRAGELVVARSSIVGSLLANALLVLGLAIMAGALRAPDGVMRFSRRLPNDTSTLLLLAVFMIVLLGLSDSVGDRASRHQTTISAIGAVCLLVVYVAWLYAYLRHGGGEDAAADAGRASAGHRGPPLRVAVVLLAFAGVGAALVSDWFVAAIDPAADSLGLSKAFVGLVIVAIAGNAVENVVGVLLAWKGDSELAVAVVKNSVSQIAVFLFPVLVLVSLLFTTHLTFVLSPVYIGALGLTAIAVWQITGDGEATLFEGAALVATYAIVATLTFYE